MTHLHRCRCVSQDYDSYHAPAWHAALDARAPRSRVGRWRAPHCVPTGSVETNCMGEPRI